MVAWARENVPLYRHLYAGIAPVTDWQAFRRLPILTASRLRATPLADQVDDLNDVMRTLTPYRLQTVVPPAARVLDRDDTDALFDATRAALALAGVRRGHRLLLIAPPDQRYVAAEIAEQTGYYDIETHVVIQFDGVADRAARLLAPDHTICLGSATAGDCGAITVRNATSTSTDLYLVPEAGIIAVRPSGAAAYRVLTAFHLLESGRDGRLLLTTLLRHHQPLIRYQLPDRGRIERGLLHLDEVAL